MSLTDRPLDPQDTPFSSLDLVSLAAELRSEPPYENGKNSRVLVRSQEMSLILSALKEGSELKAHHAPTTASVIVLQGELLFSTHGDKPEERSLGPHQCVVFSASVEHSVKALSNCLFLITMGGR